ncbi:MAG: hypothetical protein U0457_03275 [Candidatus Sericytochromatia bacterium]
MSGFALNGNDFSNISRFLDSNNNNTVEKTEAEITSTKPIGNGNTFSGTKELSDSLAKGDAFLTKVNKPSADKIADYFSTGRNTNLKPDAWISKDDLQMTDRVRSVIDTNNDNRVSTKEFSEALSSGKIAISNNGIIETPARNINSDPFNNKPAPKPINNDPFAPKTTPQKPINSDPFAGGAKTVNNDPFANGSKTTTNKPSADPFSGNLKVGNPVNSDPFAGGGSKPINSDPFAPKPSGNKPNNIQNDPFAGGGSKPINSDPFAPKPNGNKPNDIHNDPFAGGGTKPINSDPFAPKPSGNKPNDIHNDPFSPSPQPKPVYYDPNLDLLANSNDWKVRKSVALNPNTSPQTLLKLSNDFDSDVKAAVSNNPMLTNPYTPSEALTTLANSGEWKVRKAVAQHPNTSAQTLLKLGNDFDSDVKSAVSNNPKLTNPYTKSEDLSLLASAGEWKIRKAVAQHPNTSAQTLLKLSNDFDSDVKAAVSNSPIFRSLATRPTDLDLLAGSGDWKVRKAVAQHPNTSTQTLYRLSNDFDSDVKRAAEQAIQMRIGR